MKASIALLLAVLATVVAAAEPTPSGDAARPVAKMKMDEPMSTGMMKPGMKKGDVKKAGERRKKKMTPMLEQEQQSMPRPAAK